MSETLERGAEIIKLARLLGVEPKELDYLEQIPSAQLRAFREQTTDRLFAGDAGRLSRVAAASKLVPIPVTVKVAQIAFGPLLCAATAGLLDPRHAVKVATKCPTTFLADITINLDPRRASEVIAAVPTPLVVAVATKLVAREEHVTIGRFVAYLSRSTLRAAVPSIADADLLKVAFVMEGKEKLDELIDLARDRFGGLLRAAHDHDLWAEALDLVGHLSLENRAALAAVATAADAEVLESLVRAVQSLGAWDALLPITSAMSPDSLRRFADVAAIQDPAVIGQIVNAAIDGGLWLGLLPLTRYLPDEARAQAAAHAAARDDVTLEQLATEAHEAGQWGALLPLALAFDPAARRRLAELPLLQRPDVLRAAVRAAADEDLWPAVLPLAAALPDQAHAAVAVALGELDAVQLGAALTAARDSDELPTLVALTLRQEPAGRARVLATVAESEHLDDIVGQLTTDAPAEVWAALTEVGDELPANLRGALARRAAECGRDDVAAALS